MKLEMKIAYYSGNTGEFIKVDEEKCNGCGDCKKFCTRNVWIEEGKIYKPKNLKMCVECFTCWNVCKFDAVLASEPKGGTGVKFAYG